MERIEDIRDGDTTLCRIIRFGTMPDQTTFLTPDEFSLQVGYVAYPAESEIPRHIHLPLKRNLVGTGEVLLLQKGRCEVEVFNRDRRSIATRELRTGDILITLQGGHGFRVIEETVFLEIKQGPYKGPGEKERF